MSAEDPLTQRWLSLIQTMTIVWFRQHLVCTVDNVTDLHGQTVSIPVDTVSHYKMLCQMAHLDVDVEQLEIVDLSPEDGRRRRFHVVML